MSLIPWAVQASPQPTSLTSFYLDSFHSVAYVEFFELEDVRKAIALSGTKLFGIPLLVQYTEAERNRQAGLPQPPPPPNVPEHISV